jgi:transcriptional/translational regulatory protein YebC/TACO1
MILIVDKAKGIKVTHLMSNRESKLQVTWHAPDTDQVAEALEADGATVPAASSIIWDPRQRTQAAEEGSPPGQAWTPAVEAPLREML